jgi:hypothetical protein
LILLSRLTNAAFDVCFIAHSVEVCLGSENCASHPNRLSFLSVYFIQLRIPQDQRGSLTSRTRSNNRA